MEVPIIFGNQKDRGQEKQMIVIEKLKEKGMGVLKSKKSFNKISVVHLEKLLLCL